MKKILWVFFWIFSSIQVQATGHEIEGRIADEIESAGGHGLGFSNSAMAASSDLASIRNNPAMLAIEKQYQVSAGYHWPSYGREFYQVGIVDSKTSTVAAGVLYTGTQKNFSPVNLEENFDQNIERYFDSPIRHRISLGLGYTLQQLALGVTGQYVEFLSNKKEKQKGTTLSLGTAGLITPVLRFGFSGENITTHSLIKNVAPKTYRGALAYSGVDGIITLHLDWKKRQRVDQENSFDQKKFEILNGISVDDEQSLTGSFSVKFQDMLRLIGAYGQSLEDKPRRFVSGGIAVVQENFSLSYLIAQPYLNRKQNKNHQGINLAINMAL